MITHPTSGYLACPEYGVAHAIREFLHRRGTSTAVDIRRGIAADIEAARFIISEVCTALGRMTKQGVLSRVGKLYTLDLDRCPPQRKKPIPGVTVSGKKLAQLSVDVITELSWKVHPDKRGDTLSEMYLLLASGEYGADEHERLFLDAKKAVARNNPFAVKKFSSLDCSFSSLGKKTLLDVLSNDGDRDETFLTLTEELAEELSNENAPGVVS